MGLPGLSVERTPSSLRVNGETALTPAKTQQRLAALVGDFATWQRTRVFDADLTARFGASGDGDRKKLLEQLLGLEKLDAGLRRVREDIREAERLHAAAGVRKHRGSRTSGTPTRSPTFDAAALARNEELLQRGRASPRRYQGGWKACGATAKRAGSGGPVSPRTLPTCEQSIPLDRWLRVRDAAVSALNESISEQRQAAADVSRLLADVRKLRAQRAEAERAAQTAARYAELTERREKAEAERVATTLHQASGDQKPLLSMLGQSCWRNLGRLRVGSVCLATGPIYRRDMVCTPRAADVQRAKRGHRRLCDMAVLLGLSQAWGDAKLRGLFFSTVRFMGSTRTGKTPSSRC